MQFPVSFYPLVSLFVLYDPTFVIALISSTCCLFVFLSEHMCSLLILDCCFVFLDLARWAFGLILVGLV